MKPDRLAGIIDDHRCVLAGAFLSWPLLRGDEDVTGSRIGRVHVHLDDGRAEIRARAESPLLPRSPRLSSRPSARGRPATKGAGQCDPGGSCRKGPEKLSTCDPCSQVLVSCPLTQIRPLVA